MNAVFLDTVGLLALWDRSDQWHDGAERAFTQILDERLPVLTTTFVLLECGNAAARRPYRAATAMLREELEKADMLIWPTAEDWQQAWSAYQRGDAAQAGIVDNISFATMRRLSITRVFTNDYHFQAAGFETLF